MHSFFEDDAKQRLDNLLISTHQPHNYMNQALSTEAWSEHQRRFFPDWNHGTNRWASNNFQISPLITRGLDLLIFLGSLHSIYHRENSNKILCWAKNSCQWQLCNSPRSALRCRDPERPWPQTWNNPNSNSDPRARIIKKSVRIFSIGYLDSPIIAILLNCQLNLSRDCKHCKIKASTHYWGSRLRPDRSD